MGLGRYPAVLLDGVTIGQGLTASRHASRSTVPPPVGHFLDASSVLLVWTAREIVAGGSVFLLACTLALLWRRRSTLHASTGESPLFDQLLQPAIVLDDTDEISELNEPAESAFETGVALDDVSPPLAAALETGARTVSLSINGVSRRYAVTVLDRLTSGDRLVVLSELPARQPSSSQFEDATERQEDTAPLLAHDLCDPLTVAMGQVELERDRLSRSGYEQLVIAHDRMEQLLDEALAMGHTDGGAVDRTALSLATVARDCWEQIDTGTARLRIEADRLLEADETRLSRLFENLFRNSIEHGTGDADQVTDVNRDHLTVTVGLLDTGGFYVADDGCGIADPDRLFERGHSTRPEGTGLGMTIVKRVIDAHGWDIRVVEATPGARFEIRGIDSTKLPSERASTPS
jgi:signal transduction histidine kinase